MTDQTTPETKEVTVPQEVPLTRAECIEAKVRLETILTKLYYDPKDMFYAHLFFQIDRRIDSKCPTMGVGLKGGNLQLVYNPRFMGTLDDESITEVLKHEVFHIINQHLHRGEGAKNKDMTLHQLENIAMDNSINQYLNKSIIEKIGGVTMETFTKILKNLPDTFKVKEKMPYEYYLELLKQEKDAREKNGEGDKFQEMLEGMEMDDHGQFGEMDALDRAMLEEKIKQAASKAKAAGAGNMPSEVEELLKLLKKPKITWKRELKQFIGAGLKSESRSTRSRRNRYYGIKVAGKKKDHVARILVLVDESGSMHWNNRRDNALSEMYGIWKANPSTELDICEFSMGTTQVFKYKGKDEYKASGGGGTCPNESLKYAQDNKYDGVIVLSDCEFFSEIYNPNINTLFVCVDNPSYKSPFGRTIHIPSGESV